MKIDKVEIGVTAIGNHRHGYVGELHITDGTRHDLFNCGHEQSAHNSTKDARDCMRRKIRRALEHAE